MSPRGGPGAAPEAGAAHAGAGGFILRALLFGVIATVVLTAPEALGLDLAPWRGIDGALVLLLLAGVGCFGWPPTARTTLARSGLDLTVAAASVGLFAVLAASAAGVGLAGGPGPPAASVASGASGVSGAGGALALGGAAAALVLAGRLGGWPGAAAAVAFAALVGSLGAGGAEPQPLAHGPALELLPVTLELEGPLDSGEVRIGDAPPMEIRAALGQGATRRLLAWLPAPVDRAPGPVALEVGGVLPPGPGSRVRAEVVPPWSPPPSLAARPRPPVPREWRRAPPTSGLLVAWGGLFCLLGAWARLRARRPRSGAITGSVLGCLLTLGLAGLSFPLDGGRRPAILGGGAPGAPCVRVLEGAAGSDAWLQIDRVRRRLVIEGLDSLRAAIQLWGSGLRRCSLDATVPGGRLELVLDEGVIADLLRPLDPGLRVLRPELNGWGDMDPAWIREEPLGWRALSSRGPWGVGDGGAPAPPAGGADRLSSPAAGPGGRSAGLPAWAHGGPGGGPGGGHAGGPVRGPDGGMGGADWVILGRLSGEGYRGLEGSGTGHPGGSAGPEDPGERGAEVWLRLTGGAPSTGR